jgi:hypothetical protein
MFWPLFNYRETFLVQKSQNQIYHKVTGKIKQAQGFEILMPELFPG